MPRTKNPSKPITFKFTRSALLSTVTLGPAVIDLGGAEIVINDMHRVIATRFYDMDSVLD